MVHKEPHVAKIRQQEGLRVPVRCARLYIFGQLRVLQRHDHHHREEVQDTFENDRLGMCYISFERVFREKRIEYVKIVKKRSSGL